MEAFSSQLLSVCVSRAQNSQRKQANAHHSRCVHAICSNQVLFSVCRSGSLDAQPERATAGDVSPFKSLFPSFFFLS